MTYNDIVLEEADELLLYGSSVLEASGGGHGNGGSGGGSGGQNGGRSRIGFMDKLKAGNYIPFSGNPKVKDMVSRGVLKPYGFDTMDITDTKKLKQVMASIKRRRDIEAARATIVVSIEATMALLTGAIGHGLGNMSKDPENVEKFGTYMSSFSSGASNVFKAISIVSTAVALFTEVANMVDAVKATKEIAMVRNNIMDAYDNISAKITHSKPANGDLKEIENYNNMLKFRDMLRDCQLQLGTIGGTNADAYTADM